MNITLKSKLVLSLAVSAAIGLSAATVNAQMAPFGGDDDVAYAASLWAAMKDLKLAGDGAIHGTLYEGTEPHGFVLETFYAKATINGHTGDLIVKRNYGPKDVETDTVSMNPGKHLGAVTVMFRREAGYDADNKNWFWAKYLPDGTMDKNPKGMKLAGKVAKGAKKGCIACHTGAPGGDYIFTSDAIK